MTVLFIGVAQKGGSRNVWWLLTNNTGPSAGMFCWPVALKVKKSLKKILKKNLAILKLIIILEFFLNYIVNGLDDLFDGQASGIDFNGIFCGFEGSCFSVLIAFVSFFDGGFDFFERDDDAFLF